MHKPLLLALISAWISTAAAAETGRLNEHLEPFRPFLGRTWKGELKEDGGTRVRTDVARWERALNGEAIRVLHSVDDGAYGGETIIIWDAARKKVVYFYFTTAGFRTTGEFVFEGGKYLAAEEVTGEAQSVTKVRTTGELRADGTMVSKSEYLKDGRWVPGHERSYREAPGAEVKFK